MKKFQQYYKFKLWEKLKEAGISFTHENFATLLIENSGEKDGKRTAHVLYSKTVNPFQHQSNPYIEVTATGFFTLESSALLFRPDYYIFVFGEGFNAIHFIIIPYSDFIKKLELQNRYPVFDKKLKLRFCLLPGNRLVETTNISPEGEWYFLSGEGAKTDDSKIDYSPFLNHWEVLTE